MNARTIAVLGVMSAALGAILLSSGVYIHAKAWLAQRLIEQAWMRTLNGERDVRPWPWADTWPIARLRVPELNTDLFVLADASPRTLAFGPGLVHGLSRGEQQVLAAHRDTHFAFLQRLRVGAVIYLEMSAGPTRTYRMIEAHVLDVRDQSLSLDTQRPTLVLLTCYPFDALTPGGPLRYVALAEALEHGEQS